MWRLPDPRFDVASALDRGSRDYQEDSLVTDFPIGDDCGIVVLADGMGGHAAGDVASNIIVTEVFGDLKFHRPLFIERADELPEILSEAAVNANDTLGRHVKSHPDNRGMGTTLVAAAMIGPSLYWTSIGDSPLYLYRAGTLKQLNEDHSMAPQIDAMVKSGMMSEEEAKFHPDRNSLTSAVFGGVIPKIDLRKSAFTMEAGDILIVSSDGLQFLGDKVIERLVHKNRRKSGADISNVLLQALKKLDDPDQDNISFAVIKVNHDKPLQKPVVSEKEDNSELGRLPGSLTKLASGDLMTASGADDEGSDFEEDEAAVARQAAGR